MIGSCSARDIPIVLEERAKLIQDRFYVKYYDSWIAYPRLRSFFLDHTEYTHLILAPDDLIVKRSHMKQLCNDILESDYPVISGMCNVDTKNLKDFVAVSKNLPLTRYLENQRHYDWYSRKEILDLAAKMGPIVQVPFAGTPLMAIRRDIIEKIDFEPDGNHNENPGNGHSQDLMFCNNCHKNNIPIMVDTRIDMMHLRYGGELMLGKLDPMLIYVCNSSRRF